MINNHQSHSLQILHRASTLLTEEQQQQGGCSQGDDSDNFFRDFGRQSQSFGLDSNGPLIMSLPQGLEYEIASCESQQEQQDDIQSQNESWKKYSFKECRLFFFFAMLVFTGVGNVLTTKLQAVSMYNYGVFLSIFSYVVYVPLCFAFILPVARYGWFDNSIPTQHMALPKRPFAIMGFLDCLSAVMQTFASIYLPGTLLVLLPQASIPLSMVLSKHMLGERYRFPQYIGAVVVFVGVLLVMEPTITYRNGPDYLCEAIDLDNHCTICLGALSQESCLQIVDTLQTDSEAFTSSLYDFFGSKQYMNMDMSTDPTLKSSFRKLQENDELIPICHWVSKDEAATDREWSVLLWSIVMVISCVPMTLSSVYKQIKLRAHGDLHPVFLIGWIGIFQLLFSIVSAPGLGWATGIPLAELPQNVWNGFKCYLGESSVESGCHPDSLCSSGHAFLLVNLCLFCQAMYIVCVVLVLKYGSTSLLYLALTMMVPLGNLIFSLPIASIYVSNTTALLVIVSGLLLYRFGGKFARQYGENDGTNDTGDGGYIAAAQESAMDPCHRLLEPLITYAYV